MNLKKTGSNCYNWCTAFNGSETLTLWEVDKKHLESFRNVVLKKDEEDQLDQSCVK
jgi:hypothetical protein